MVPPEPTNRAAELDQSTTAIHEDSKNNLSFDHNSSPRKGRPWVTALGVVIFILGALFGWRWWQGSHSAAEGGAGPGAAQAQAAPVALETTKTSTVQDSSEFVGTLESRRSVELKPEIDGRVSRILVKPGDRVEAGDVLVQLDPDQQQAEYASVLASINSARAIRASASSELQALQADRLSKVADVELQQENFRRTSVLVEQGALAQDQLDQAVRDRRNAIAQLNATDRRIQGSRASLAESEAALEAAKANAAASNSQLQNTAVTAPFSGTVGDVPVKLGDYVQSGDTLTSVTQNQFLELQIPVPLERGPDLRTGQRVEMLDSQGKPVSVGQINFTAPQVNAAAQSILVKANFDNPDGRLLAGQFIRVRLIWNERPGILIPTAAISRLGGQTFVFVAERQKPKEGQPQSDQPQVIARQKQVKLGDIQGNSYQVLEGLKPGERVVVSGVLNLSDGVPINPQS